MKRANGSHLNVVENELDTETKHRANKLCTHTSELFSLLGRTPSLGMYRVQEHIRKCLPDLLECKSTVGTAGVQAEERTYDVEYAFDAVKDMQRSSLAAVRDLLESHIRKDDPAVVNLNDLLISPPLDQDAQKEDIHVSRNTSISSFHKVEGEDNVENVADVSGHETETTEEEIVVKKANDGLIIRAAIPAERIKSESNLDFAPHSFGSFLDDRRVAVSDEEDEEEENDAEENDEYDENDEEEEDEENFEGEKLE